MPGPGTFDMGANPFGGTTIKNFAIRVVRCVVSLCCPSCLASERHVAFFFYVAFCKRSFIRTVFFGVFKV